MPETALQHAVPIEPPAIDFDGQTLTHKTGPDITIVTPAYCEAANIPILVERLKLLLDDYHWELVVVDDDSPDGTASIARDLARRDARVRILHRLRRRGLAGAVVEGLLSSSAPLLVVMDADLQHDEAILPRMIDLLQERSEIELVIGTRYAAEGSAAGLNRLRLMGSRLATRLAEIVCGVRVSDPMSGFFAVRRDAFMSVAHRLSTQGFKILLDVLASSRRPLNVAEIPYRFREREHGASKLDSAVLWQYAELLLEKTVGDWFPVRLIRFGLVGSLGLLVHMAALFAAFKLLAAPFAYAQVAAALLAMTSNYFLNNVFTFKDRRLKGWRSLLGLFSFYAVCSVGMFANVGVAAYAFQQQTSWWLAGIAGILVGMVWNYAVSSRITWRQTG